MANILSFLPLGGTGDVTKNMYVYEYEGQILLVDCGIGFADETMLGVDLLLPDITYLKNTKSKIVGMLITHGHEDHMGALPYILPQLPDFPIFATPFTAALANEKLADFGVTKKIQAIDFGKGQEVKLGVFSASFIRVTHSVPDTSHIVIKTPVGTVYHGSDYKFDLTPFDKKTTDFAAIAEVGKEGVLALMTDCLGSERAGYTPSEAGLENNFLNVMRTTEGKCLITTYSSNINRINQIITATQAVHRRICFVGRSLINTVEVAKQEGLLILPKGMEVRIDQLNHVKDNDIVLIVAGSQGQENSAMTRIASGIHKDIKLKRSDVVIFSADTIPGNEVLVNSLIDMIAKVGAKVWYSALSHDFHVSGHASQQEMQLLLSLVKPKYVFPISGTYKHMVAYKNLAKKLGYPEETIFLSEDGQEVTLSQQMIRAGRKIPVRTIYVDQISGEEVEKYVLMDRQQLSSEGLVIIMIEMDSTSGQLLHKPEIISRGFAAQDLQELTKILIPAIQKTLGKGHQIPTNWALVRKLVSEVAERVVYQQMKRKPLILPVVIDL